MLTRTEAAGLRAAAIVAIWAAEQCVPQTNTDTPKQEREDRLLEKDLAVAQLDDLIHKLTDADARLASLQSNQIY